MADEPERRIVGAIHAELEKQVNDGNLESIGYLNTNGSLYVTGELDLYLLAQVILKEVEPAKPPRFIEFDLPALRIQNEDPEEEPLTIWEVPMRPRNLPSAPQIHVRVPARSAEEALSKALSARPGHSWDRAINLGKML